jgi:hypothetical protein
MKKYLVLLNISALFFLGLSLLMAHPHFNKVVTVKLPGDVEATVTYQTVPSNEDRVTRASVGDFLTPRNPKLKLSKESKAGNVLIPPGEYIIGAIKNGNNDFTMALYPGSIARGERPDMAKMIKLESEFSASEGKAPHLLIDISPGSGEMEGRAVLTLHFGSLFLAGALD